MKQHKYRMFGFAFALAAIACVAVADVPRPTVVYYGMAKDRYGYPYQSGAEVYFKSGSNIVASYTITGVFAPSVNFKLRVEIDDGTGSNYVSNAVREGDPLNLFVKVNGVERPFMQSNTLFAGNAGDAIAVYITTSTDIDNDGLPDDWESLALANSGGVVNNISQITPEGDLDGDGVSNMEEYLAGTFAFLDFDYFSITSLGKTANNKRKFSFLTAPGMMYQFQVTHAVDSYQWTPVPFSVSESDPASHQALLGNGYFVNVYFDQFLENQRYVRVRVQ